MNLALSPACFKAVTEGGYIGIPWVDMGRTFDGWDCYGLVYCVSRHDLGLIVPSYVLGYTSSMHDESVCEALRFYSQEWANVTGEQREVGDVLVFNLGGIPVHCGLVVEPGLMLHCLKGRETVLEQYSTAAWRSRIEGVYRWM
jgi:cell wall-associated NlpC family hydrolase